MNLADRKLVIYTAAKIYAASHEPLNGFSIQIAAAVDLAEQLVDEVNNRIDP